MKKKSSHRFAVEVDAEEVKAEVRRRRRRRAIGSPKKSKTATGVKLTPKAPKQPEAERMPKSWKERPEGDAEEPKADRASEIYQVKTGKISQVAKTCTSHQPKAESIIQDFPSGQGMGLLVEG